MIYCGMSELEITPPLGSTIPGYFTDRKSTGIMDPLFVKAGVVESDERAFAFVVLDVLLITSDLTEKIRRREAKLSPILPEHVMVSATHTHTGPPVSTTTFYQADEAYKEWLVKKAADAIVLAYEKREEAQIGYGIGHEGEIAFHRRYFMKDGTLQTNPGIGNPNVDRPAGPIDPQVSVIRIDNKDGKPLGVVTNYALHTDTVGGTLYSGDFPGELSAVIKKVLGPEAVSMFMMGASGNINHIDVLGTGKLGDVRRPHIHQKIGRILAGEVLKVREKIAVTDRAPVQSIRAELTFRYRQPTQQEVDEAKKALQESSPDEVEHNFAKELLQAYESGEGEVSAEVQVARIGDIAVTGIPSEIFVEFGLQLKEASPFPITIINELCNGSPGTYLCTREAYEQGGYEPKITSNNRLQIDAGEMVISKAIELLRALA
mgnify:CR=1 FL=1